MTREEEIKQAAEEYSGKDSFFHYAHIHGFELGAQWADEYPKDNLVEIDEFLKKARIYLINKGMVHNSIELDEFDKAMKRK